MGSTRWAFTLLFLLAASAAAQDSSFGSLRGAVIDPSGARIASAMVSLTNPATGYRRSAKASAQGSFAFDLLPPGEYDLTATMSGFQKIELRALKVDVGGSLYVAVSMRLAGSNETVVVNEATPAVETQPSSVSEVIDQRAIEDLPLNGRRFTDLALLTPGVTQDPRGLTSATNGDLAFGGVRGYNSSYLVDGADNNNGFFAQARGRYRAPYQFSNETVQEFRVSSNTYGTELGRSGGAVVNVVTRSGTNSTHGSAFYFLRDGRFAATHPFVKKQYADKQDQFGASVGGPIRRNKIFYFAGFDQHIFHIPTVVQFDDGTTQVTPKAQDYEASDQALVFATADQLSKLGGQFRTKLLGNAGFLKVDANLNSTNHLSFRFNSSRFYGDNNVFFDPASPITNFAISENGEEDVATESANIAWTSALGSRWSSHLRYQFSHDDQESIANSDMPRTNIKNVIDGFGRSTILPRRTNEHRSNFAETMSWQGSRHAVKFGFDAILTKTTNHFPLNFGGGYIFDNIKVNPFTFVPQTFGLKLTPLRAFAHEVPRYYMQDFGNANSHPDSNEFAGFLQDTVRMNSHLALSFGLRYDLQTFNSAGLHSNPLWPDSGKVPFDTNNVSPRAGFAASIGNNRPLVVRGGFGLFYTRIPQIYTSTIEVENGINRSHLFLDNSNFFQRQVFPTYPNPAASCPSGTGECDLPPNLASFVTTEVSSFARDFQTPYVEQASLTAEKEVFTQTAISASYLFVAGKHLIRARDVNLPQPVVHQYPVFDDTGTNFAGEFYSVESFSDWQFAPSLTCPFPPCINDLQRPISNLGAINSYEGAASSFYNGLTISAKRRVGTGMYFRLAYTWANATDNGQDALVAGSPALVQNTFATAAEKGRSVTDQRHRFVFAFSADPKPFHRDHPVMQKIFNDWKFAGVFTAGSGRPITARISGDANQDGNAENDRLPGAKRNGFNGPDYMSGDLRVTRSLHIHERLRVEFSAESFNIFNHNNKRVTIADSGFTNIAAGFVGFTTAVNGVKYPGQFRRNPTFLQPDNAYSPRQIQFSARLKF